MFDINLAEGKDIFAKDSGLQQGWFIATGCIVGAWQWTLPLRMNHAKVNRLLSSSPAG